MMKKLIYNCKTHKQEEIEMTAEEIQQRELEQQQAEQQALIESLKPTAEEVIKAELQIEILTTLQEVGLI